MLEIYMIFWAYMTKDKASALGESAGKTLQVCIKALRTGIPGSNYVLVYNRPAETCQVWVIFLRQKDNIHRMAKELQGVIFYLNNFTQLHKILIAYNKHSGVTVFK